MGRKSAVLLICIMLAFVSTDGLTQTRSQQSQERLSAPKIVPRTTAEMQTPQFWISRLKNPDRVIMTPEQIRELNKKNSTRGTHFNDVFGNPYSIDRVLESRDQIGIMYHVEDPLSYRSFPSDSLRFRIERQNTWFEKSSIYDFRGMIMDEVQKKEILDNTNVASITNSSVKPFHGIIVKHTLGKIMPYELPTGTRSGSISDGMQAGMVDYGQPVAVMHVSRDGRWYYVRSDIAFVWIQADHVALGSPEKIREYNEKTDFIVATCHKVPIYADRDFKVYLTDFYMGNKVELLGRTDRGYRVNYPFRAADGSFTTAVGWVKPDAGVHEGYQVFTQRNILNTIFSLLYRPYSWADSWNERDCCGTIRVVLRTFGIYTGRWTTHQLHASDHVVMFPQDTPKEKKYEFLEACEGGNCLVGDGGHISMYIGKVDGRHYVIHQSGYSYTDENGDRLNVRRVNVNDTELEGGSNIGSWTEITTLKP